MENLKFIEFCRHASIKTYFIDAAIWFWNLTHLLRLNIQRYDTDFHYIFRVTVMVTWLILLFRRLIPIQ